MIAEVVAVVDVVAAGPIAETEHAGSLRMETVEECVGLG